MAARSWGVTLCAGAVLAAASHGCVVDGVSAHVICALAPPAPMDGMCMYTSEDDVCLLGGVMNLLATDHYDLVLRVQSGLKPRVRQVPPQGETNRIKFNRAKVELRSASGARFRFEDAVAGDQRSPSPNPYYVTASGDVSPDGTGLGSATLITPQYAQQLNKLFAAPGTTSAQIVVAVTLEGITDGDTEVGTAEYEWPVRVIRASVNPADPASGCVQQDDFCRSTFGQDVYANTCSP